MINAFPWRRTDRIRDDGRGEQLRRGGPPQVHDGGQHLHLVHRRRHSGVAQGVQDGRSPRGLHRYVDRRFPRREV